VARDSSVNLSQAEGSSNQDLSSKVEMAMTRDMLQQLS
jgi:hypothetical protein